MKAALLFLLICLGPLAVKKQDTHQAKGHRQIYLLMGQSNMAGRGKITPAYQNLQYDRVKMLNQDMEWVTAKHPVHFDKPRAAGVGPGLSFGAAIANAYPLDTIFLVPCAVGGTSISKWEPGAYDESTKTHPYDDALIRIKEAMKTGSITGVLWLQGESDSKPASAQVYLSKLEKLINSIRSETKNPKLPFLAGELGAYRANYQLINGELAKLSATVPFTALVSSQGLVHKGDTTHFDSPSATAYGRRFAIGMLKLLK
jgi:hypothetical protein